MNISNSTDSYVISNQDLASSYESTHTGINQVESERNVGNFYLKQAEFSNCLCDEDLVDFDLSLALYGTGSDGMSTCLVKELNMDFIELRHSEVKARLTLSDIHCRPTPHGPILHGGTSLAIAETIAGVASMALCNGKDHPVGVAVNANHVAMARKGQSLTITCCLIHKNKSSHLWDVDILDEYSRLISTATVTNAIIKMQKD